MFIYSYNNNNKTKKMSLDSLLGLFPMDNRLFPLILSAFFFLAMVACFYKLLFSPFSKMNLPPGPKPLPVLGNIHQVVGSQLHVVLHDMAKTYGPICYLKVGQLSFISVTSSEVSQEILKTQEHLFSQRPEVPVMEMTSFDHGSIAFAPHGEYWRQARKICVMGLLSPGRVRHFRSLREQEIGNLIESVKCTSGLPFNISEMIFASSNNIISMATFGHICNRPDELVSTIKEQLRLAGQFSLLDIFPSLRFWYYLNGTKAQMRRFQAVYDDVLGSTLAEGRARAKSQDYQSSYEENLVDVLLRLKESPENRISLNDNTIKDIIFDMIVGGTDSTPTAVEWALSEMLKNPGVMKKAQTELRDALKGKAVLEEADLENIKYLKLIIKETLRLHPPVTTSARVTGETCIVHGYDIPKSSIVIINNWSLGRDPNYWENPEKFEPERFLHSSIDLLGNHFEFIPFGSGKRMCPGAGFAISIIELILANLLYCFDWEMANGVSPDELDMAEVTGLVVHRLNPLFVVTTPHCSTA